MRKNLFLILSLSGFISISFMLEGCKSKPVSQVRQIPLEDFFRNPEKTRYQISPDGKYFSFFAPYENRMNIFIQEIGKDSAVRLTSETDRDIMSYFWKNPTRILYLKDTGGDENWHLYGVNVDGSDLKCFTDFPGVRTDVINTLDDFPSEVIIGLNKRNPEVFDAYRLNVETGELKMIAENPGNIQAWYLDHAGKLRAASAIVDGVNTQLLFRDKESDPFKAVLTTSFKEALDPQFFTFDNKHLFAISNLNRDKSVAVIFDPVNGKEVEVLYENPDNDIEYLAYSEKRKVLTAAIYESWKRERHFFDEETKLLFERLKKDLGAYELNISATDKEEQKFIIRTYSDRSLGSYYIYDKVSDQLNKITDVSTWMKEEELAPMYPIDYQSRDGVTIHGYLTLPVGYTLEDAKDLPVVVNPHGGPWARDSWGFNPEIQFLANRGYAILQPNFRGSTGYGKKFWESSFKQWGLTMQDDVTDGTKWMIEKGIADPDRIAIYGGSYGGYATLQGLVREPDLYAAGVDYVGVSNLFTFMKTIPPYWKPLLEMMYEMVGNPVTDSVQFTQTSPVLNAEKIKAPLFIAQGANDPRVNKAESDQMVEALKKRGIVVEYMVKDNEGHGFYNEENRFDFYRAMEKFLGAQLK